mgnify:CR=1 FL=1
MSRKLQIFLENRKVKQVLKHLQCILIPTTNQEVSALVQKLWIPESRKTTVCVDSYREGILQGRFYGPDGSAYAFPSLSRFLVQMEEMLELNNEPQSDTKVRSFSTFLLQPHTGTHFSSRPRGELATFELQILFRQHTSWQGVLFWKEQHREQSFRSVLEMILLMDSALREQEELEAG